jgi:Protein of unknown function (DUF2933)
MSLHDHSEHEEHPQRSFLSSRAGFVLIGFLIIGGALLFTEHRAHVLGILIWLPLLACPLMHIFMHGGHGGHGSHESHDQQKRERGTS